MERIVEFVKSQLENDNSGHDFDHAQRVVNNAKKILKHEKAKSNIVIVSCYLHDCVDKKLFDDIEGQINKIQNLLHNDFTKEEVDQIIDIITSISYNGGDFKELTNLEAMIVRDADRLDAMGSIGIIRTIEFGNSKKRKFYDEENLKILNNKIVFNNSTQTTISHFYDKLLKLDSLMHTKYAKKEAKRRKKIMIKFLKEFYLELR